MVHAAWRSSLLEGTWRTPKTLSVGDPMGWTNKFTLLAASARGFRGVAATGWDDQTGRRQRLAGIHHPGGERRYLFGVGEGPTEAVAEAKQGQAISASHGWIDKADRPWSAGESGSWELVPKGLEFASFLRHSPVVNHLSLTCSATCQPLVTLVFA